MGDIIASNGIIIKEDVSPQQLDAIIRRAVLDAEIPILKPIAYSITNKELTKQSKTIKLTYRHQNCLESYIDIGQAFQDLLFVDLSYERAGGKALLYVDAEKGRVTKDSKFIDSYNQTALKVLTTEADKICTVKKKVLIKVCAIEHSGYLRMSEAQEIVKSKFPEHKNEFFFYLNTYFNIGDYVKILPFDGSNVRYRLCNGMTDLFFQILLMKWEAKNGSKI